MSPRPPKDKGPQWRVGLYIRLSREDGGDESLSVANQRKILRGHLETEFGAYADLREYVDDGATGTDLERPGFQRLLRDIEGGAVNCVLCKNLSRAFRNYADQGYFLESFFPRHHTRFIALETPKIDSYLNPAALSGYEVPISGIMNDRYAARVSQDVRRTFDMKRRRGEFIGAFAPYGYRKDPEDKNRLLPDGEAAAVVWDIFSWFVDGMSRRAIARRLNELGVPNPARYKQSRGLRYANPNGEKNDGLWSPRTISSILQNQVYAGAMVQGRQRVVSYKVHSCIPQPREDWFVVEDTHPAIVEPELFALVQELRTQTTRTPPGAGRVSLLAGLVYCGGCGKAMGRSGGGERAYYTCRTHAEKSHHHCQKRSIRVEVVEGVALAAVQRLLGRLGREELVSALTPSSPAKGRETGKERQRRELEQVRSGLDGVYLDFKSGLLGEEDYRRLSARLRARAERLEGALSSVKQEEGPDTYREELLERGNIDRLERGLAAALVQRICVEEDGGLTIALRCGIID